MWFCFMVVVVWCGVMGRKGLGLCWVVRVMGLDGWLGLLDLRHCSCCFIYICILPRYLLTVVLVLLEWSSERVQTAGDRRYHIVLYKVPYKCIYLSLVKYQ